jgi:ABC-2 type transport system permease protein
MSALTGTISSSAAAKNAPTGRATADLIGKLAGTWQLTKLALRRDRLLAPIWMLTISSFAVSTAAAYQDLYPTVASRLPFARQIEGSPGLLALSGPAFDLTSTGGLTAWRVTGLCSLIAAVMSVLMVVRHTRAEEESNRLELLGSGVVGRFAPLAAGVLTALLTNAGLAVLIAAGLAGMGLPVIGSIALGLAIATSGMIFAAVAAVTAQLTEGPRAANGIANALAGAAFLVRAIGDSNGPGWLSWLSPIGWSQQARPFAGERWWVLIMTAGVACGLFAVGFRLAGRRDLGEGLLPTRPGAPRAAGWLRSPSALAWRLQRGALIGWAACFAVLGIAVGALAQTISNLIGDNPQAADLLKKLGGTQNPVDAYLATELNAAGIIVGAYALQAVLRLATEEADHRAEPLLATPIGRIRWALGHLVIALVGSAVLLLIIGSAIGLVYGAQSGDLSGQLPRIIGAALSQAPAAWVIAGLAVVLFGLLPSLIRAAWGAVVLTLFLSLLGPLLKLNHWLMDLSPFTHVPAVGNDFSWTPIGWLLAVTLGLCSVGLVGLQRRDIH